MIRLQEISLEKTINVEVKCSVNENVIDKNFQVLVDCLKDLQSSQSQFREELTSTNQKTDKCEKDIQKIFRQLASLIARLDSSKESSQKSKPSTSTSKKTNLQLQSEDNQSDLEALYRRFEQECQRNRKANIQNLKDINLLLGDVKEIKRKLEEMGNKVGSTVEEGQAVARPAVDSDSGHSSQHTQAFKKQMQKQLQLIKKLTHELDDLKNADAKLDKRISVLETERKNQSSSSVNQGSSTLANSLDLNQLKSLLQKYDNGLQRLQVIEQKLRLLPNGTDYDNHIASVRAWIGQLEQTVSILQQQIEGLKKQRTLGHTQLLKPEITPRPDSSSVKTKQIDIQHDNQHKWLRETLKQAITRIEQLQKSMNKERIEVTSMKQIQEGAKGEQGKSDGKDKLLPSINKRNLKLKRESLFNAQPRVDNSKQHSIILEGLESARTGQSSYDVDRKLLDIKNDLQKWMKQLFESRSLGGTNSSKKEQEYYKDIQLKIQELRVGLERKADHQGMRKYLTFLQSKVNQLFMILAQPQSQDALIARKGWGCLSCAKKLEKYKGQLGQHVNWNNFTHNNYSPPKMGFTSAQTLQNMKSVEKGRSVNPTDKSFGFDEQHQNDV